MSRPETSQSVVLEDALGQRVADEAVDAEDQDPHRRAPPAAEVARASISVLAFALERRAARRSGRRRRRRRAAPRSAPDLAREVVVRAQVRQPRLPDERLAAEDVREGARDRGASRRARGRGLARAVRVQSIAPVLGRAPAEASWPATRPAGGAAPCPPSSSSSRRSRISRAAAVTRCCTSIAVSSGPIGTASWSTMSPASAPRSSRGASRPSPSPLETAQFTGARPRYFGSSEPCMLKAPRRGRSRGSPRAAGGGK